MKSIEEENYYEILDISPDATHFEIRHAYKAALELYQENSLASYSFFSEDERNKIIARLEKAFLTLIDNETRYRHDETLIDLGVLDKKSRHRKDQKEPIPILDFKRSKTPANTTFNIPRKMNPDAASGPVLKEILAQPVLTGVDLKRIRIEFGVSLEHIAEQTKIRIGLLRYIEEDQFDQLPSIFHLKSFLKSYIQCFPVDTESVVNRYMKRIRE